MSLALGFSLYLLFVLGLILLYLADILDFGRLGRFVGFNSSVEYGNLAIAGLGGSRIIGLLDCDLLDLFASIFLDKIHVNDVVDDDVVLDIHASDKLAVAYDPLAFTIIVNNDDREVDLKKTPGGNGNPVVFRNGFDAHRNRDVVPTSPVRRQGSPRHVIATAAPAYPCRSPSGARHPVPANFLIEAPAAIVIGGPAKRLVGNPGPAVAAGINPMAFPVRTPIPIRNHRTKTKSRSKEIQSP